MAESPALNGSSDQSLTTVPSKRLHEETDQTSTVLSPLNPDFNTTTSSKQSRSTKEKTPMHREPREKKESLKKREAKGVSVQADARATPDRSTPSNAKRKPADKDQPPDSLSPLRYKLPPPKTSDYEFPRGPIYVPHHSIQSANGREIQFYETTEQKGFRYVHCIADPSFPSSLFYRQSETEPFHPRMNFEDSSSHLFFDRDGTQVTTEKGFRMARANVGVRGGRWYWECKITSGIRTPPTQNGDVPQSNGVETGTGQESSEPRGHVRMGWARREASLDAPVGFDAYSYGLRDVGGQQVHMSRPKDFFPPGEDIREGDVIGLEISLPSLALHRRVVQGQYNPAVDSNDTTVAEEAGGAAAAPDIIRDKVPIRYKAHLYFEQFEYHSTKELEELLNPSLAASTSTSGPASAQEPNPSHPLVPLRTLPDSYIRIFKNGKAMGTPFENLFAFLPLASKPLAQTGARDGLDDGMLGYFPAVSVFRGGAVEVNFGPDFWYPPSSSSSSVDKLNGENHNETGDDRSNSLRARAVSERYNEQIAEDVTYDIIDEVDFWLQDGAPSEGRNGINDRLLSVRGPVASGGREETPTSRGQQQASEIKEIVQEDE
ncbi:MAG: hypothetical protein M1816_000441 [Peltula sp. TS41687]|nr:MAG: hypothetical protein M1816_000441 [Peltula sp. TS41687]